MSLISDLGADIKYVSTQVGHANTSIGNDVYRHVLARQRGDVMGRLGIALVSKKDPTDLAGTPRNVSEQHGDGGGAVPSRVQR